MEQAHIVLADQNNPRLWWEPCPRGFCSNCTLKMFSLTPWSLISVNCSFKGNTFNLIPAQPLGCSGDEVFCTCTSLLDRLNLAPLSPVGRLLRPVALLLVFSEHFSPTDKWRSSSRWSNKRIRNVWREVRVVFGRALLMVRLMKDPSIRPWCFFRGRRINFTDKEKKQRLPINVFIGFLKKIRKKISQTVPKTI